MPNDNSDIKKTSSVGTSEEALVKPNANDMRVVRARKSPKPLVEGINTPVTNSAPVAAEPETETLIAEAPAKVWNNVISPKVTLTEAEKVLVSNPPAAAPKEPQPIMNSIPKQAIFSSDFTGQKITLPAKKSTGSKLVWGILITLLIVSLVFGALLWYDNQTGSDISQIWKSFSHPKQAQTVNNPAPQQTAPIAVPTNNIATTTAPVVVPPAASSTQPALSPSNNMQVKIKNTPTGYLNVRSSYSSGSKLVGKVLPGETYNFTDTKNDWYKIVLSDGTSGWVTGQYVTVLNPAK